MTGQELIDGVRNWFEDDEIEESSIIQAGNWVQNDLFANTRTRLMESSETITGDAGDTIIATPEDFQTLISLYITSPEVRNISDLVQSYDLFMANHANFSTADPTRISAFTFYGNAIRLAAPLDESNTFNFDYLRKPVSVENLSDSFEVPSLYDEMMLRLTVARIMEKNEDYAQASNERNLMQPMVIAFKRNEGRGNMTTVSKLQTARNRTVRRVGA